MKLITSVLVIVFIVASQSSWSQTPADSFLHPLGDEAFAAVLQFFQYDPEDLHADIVERSEQTDYIQEKIVFTGTNGERVPSLLLLPTSGQAPFPLVVILPGGDGRKERVVDPSNYESKYGEELVSKGYAVFSVDVQFHGERKRNNNYRESVYRHKLVNGWRNLVVQTVIDVRRGLDYLDSRPEIDITRTACIGGSMGGLLTFAVTGVDERIKVAASSVGLPWGQTLWRAFGWDDMPFVQSVIGPQNFAPRINDRPFLMMMATRDRYYPREDAEELFRLVNSTQKEIIWFDSEHSLPRDEQRGNALKWIYSHL